MTKIDLFNAALIKIGSQVFISGEGEKSVEFEICERVYEQALKEVYCLYPWHCCRKAQKLSKLVECENIRFKNSFQLPFDCLVVTGTIPKRIEYEVTGRIISSNEDELSVEYTANIENIGDLTPLVFELAVTNLALKILPSLAKGAYNISDSVLNNFYNIQLNNAKACDIRENFSRRPYDNWIEA